MLLLLLVWGSCAHVSEEGGGGSGGDGGGAGGGGGGAGTQERGLDSLYYSTPGARRLLAGPSPHLLRREEHTTAPAHPTPHLRTSAVTDPAAPDATADTPGTAASAAAANPGVTTDAYAASPVWPEVMPGRVVS